MRYEPEERTDRTGNGCVIRSLKAEDAIELLRFVDAGASETPFFPWAPGETDLTAENGAEYICEFEKGERKLLLGAFRNNKLIGLAELAAISSRESMRHRCAAGIALLKEAQGIGLSGILMHAVFEAAEKAGFEQMEASIARNNSASAGAAKALGYQEYGMIPHKKKNKDGTYLDERWFVKWLKTDIR